MSNWGKIAIGTRLGHTDAAFFVSWTRHIMCSMRPGDGVLSPAVGLPHAPAMNSLVLDFDRLKCDTMLVVDDDMVFSPDDVNAIRESGEEYGILGGMYCTRRWPHYPIVMKVVDGKAQRIEDISANIIDVDVVGLGFTLIRREVIQAVQKMVNQKECFGWDNGQGEDGSFCTRAKFCGYKIGVNTNVSIGHRVTNAVYWDKTSNCMKLTHDSFMA